MEKIEEKVKKLIIQHEYIASQRISKIISGEQPNWRINNQTQYLNPSTQCLPLSLNDERGLFRHYKTIDETLGRLLTGEDAYFSKEFTDAPVEIQELLKNR
jgi:hypothetical protein